MEMAKADRRPYFISHAPVTPPEHGSAANAAGAPSALPTCWQQMSGRFRMPKIEIATVPARKGSAQVSIASMGQHGSAPCPLFLHDALEDRKGHAPIERDMLRAGVFADLPIRSPAHR